MNGLTRRAAVLGCALVLDLTAGEPPAGVHPVVWLGRVIGALERCSPGRGRARQFGWGMIMAGGVPALAALAGALAQRAARRTGIAGLVAEAAALKGVFALGGLLDAGRTAQSALEAEDVEAGRAALRSLVSRETAALRPGLIAAAAIESVAENTTDSVLAPWLAYLLGGLPGAYAYRAVNTLDSMIGYRGRYEYLGKPAARVDDLLNLVPARLSAVLIAVAAPVAGGSTGGALGAVRRFRGSTASPNAGWTMSAMAGALGVRLEKPGHYVLGDGPEPAAQDVDRAARIVFAASLLAAALVGGAAAVLHRWNRGGERPSFRSAGAGQQWVDARQAGQI